jgi:flagellar FliJ protein
MKPFAFKLDPVLRHREILEDRARQELAEALQREQALQEEIDRRRAERDILQKELMHRQQQGISAQDLLLFEESIAHRGRVLSGLSHDLEKARQDVTVRREVLAAAARDRRLMEKLKENKREEHRQEMNRRETILLDEIALQMDRGRT